MTIPTNKLELETEEAKLWPRTIVKANGFSSSRVNPKLSKHPFTRSIVGQAMCKILVWMNPAQLKLTPKLDMLVPSGEPKLPESYGPPSYKLLIEATCSQVYVHIFS